MVAIEKLSSFLKDGHVDHSPRGIMILCAAAFVTYWACRFIYNIYFHPLSKFPGPTVAAASRVWINYQYFKGCVPFLMNDLHEKYGPVVRVGPNMLYFSGAKSLSDIYGYSPSRKFFPKASLYSNFSADGSTNINTEMDVKKHAHQRRVLAHSFSHSSIGKIEPVVQEYTDTLLKQCGELGGKESGVDVSELFTSFTFDLIADLAFGQKFNSLSTGKKHFWINGLMESFKAFVLLGTLFDLFGITLGMIVRALPKAAMKEFHESSEFTMNVTKARLATTEKGVDRNDLMATVIPAMLQAGFSTEDLRNNAQAIVIAGTDTLSVFFSATTFFLGRNPTAFRKLSDEIRTNFASPSDITNAAVERLPYLNAVIQESLRFFPPISVPLPRVCPGETIDGHFIPEGTEVSSSLFAATHSPVNFHDPETFLPERWLDPNNKDKKEASQPLSLGPRNCIGRYLAWMEMRLVVAKLVWMYDLELVDTKQDWVHGTKGFSFWRKAPLWVRFKRRA